MTARETRRVFTIPNMLTTLRILLVPAFIWAYLRRPGGLPVLILAISALTDLLDGKIARRFNQVSDLGKLLDPIADKLTQGAMLGCLLTRYHQPAGYKEVGACGRRGDAREGGNGIAVRHGAFPSAVLQYARVIVRRADRRDHRCNGDILCPVREEKSGDHASGSG